MPKYRVEVEETYEKVGIVEVEAETKEKAVDMATELLNDLSDKIEWEPLVFKDNYVYNTLVKEVK